MRNPLIKANSLYTPSYISLEYALSFHGLIPEGVYVITCVTTQPRKTITIEGRTFEYTRVPAGGFTLGVIEVDNGDGRKYRIASAEKALADKLVTDRLGGLTSLRAMRAFLIQDQRIYVGDLRKLDVAKLEEIALAYRSRKIRLAAEVIRRLI